MPKLSAAAAKAIAKADAIHESGTFEPLAPGKYLARLQDVSIRENTDKYGQTMWAAEFDNLHAIEDHEPAPGHQWMNLTIPSGPNKVHPNYTGTPEKWETYQNMAMGRLKAFFESFGYTVDSNTDEMLGEYAVITVRQRTIQSGPREGQITNEVSGIESLEDLDVELEDFGIELGADDESAF